MMERSNLIFGVVFVIILLSVGFVSAVNSNSQSYHRTNFWRGISNFLSKATGHAIEVRQVELGNKCVSCAEPPTGCYYVNISCNSCGQIICGEEPISNDTDPNHDSKIVNNPYEKQIPRIAYWWGKVNQHVDTSGIWVTDPDGKSGANLDKLSYCQKWYPNTVSVKPYKNETIYGWRNRGNLGGPFTSTKLSYECVQENATTNDTVKCVDSDGGIDYYLKGNVFSSTRSDLIYNDQCMNNTVGTLREYYCNSNSTVGYVYYNCSNGCENGACVETNFSNTSTNKRSYCNNGTCLIYLDDSAPVKGIGNGVENFSFDIYYISTEKWIHTTNSTGIEFSLDYYNPVNDSIFRKVFAIDKIYGGGYGAGDIFSISSDPNQSVKFKSFYSQDPVKVNVTLDKIVFLNNTINNNSYVVFNYSIISSKQNPLMRVSHCGYSKRVCLIYNNHYANVPIWRYQGYHLFPQIYSDGRVKFTSDYYDSSDVLSKGDSYEFPNGLKVLIDKVYSGDLNNDSYVIFNYSSLRDRISPGNCTVLSKFNSGNFLEVSCGLKDKLFSKLSVKDLLVYSYIKPYVIFSIKGGNFTDTSDLLDVGDFWVGTDGVYKYNISIEKFIPKENSSIGRAQVQFNVSVLNGSTGALLNGTYNQTISSNINFYNGVRSNGTSSNGTSSCNGCLLGGKCYNFGYRINGTYCSTKSFVNQLNQSAICENDFECSSNLCISSKCVSDSVWNKFLNWLNKIFS